jgi:hypothetical protein
MDYNSEQVINRQFILKLSRSQLERTIYLRYGNLAESSVDFLFNNQETVPVNVPGWMMVYGNVGSVRRWLDPST